ncbi:MAG: GPW/gp25 family protein [Bacteroidia bacterium]|nr:GPW/gp25 family protein [Bacteroidia bacterium]
MAEIESDFLGRGWAFPPKFIKSTGSASFSAEMVSETTDIDQSIQILLSTIIGERIMLPEFGCNLDDLLFEPINTTLVTSMTDRVKKALMRFEPRIKLDSMNVFKSETEGLISITLEYTIRATNTRNNLVFPFYTNEATNI